MHPTMQSTQLLNPGQSSVLGADQPIYATAKQLQWTFPDIPGEYKVLLVLGALHIEAKIHEMIGKLLRDSGWATALSQAQILTTGRAQSTLEEHHIKRTRYAHQVSLVSLHLWKNGAYSAYCSGVLEAPQSQENWDELKRTKSPQFRYWSTIMEFELLLCRFIHSQGHKITIVRTVDSDAVVLAIHFFSSLGVLEQWVCFGSGKSP